MYISYGLCSEIRTRDLPLPKRALYQTELRTDDLPTITSDRSPQGGPSGHSQIGDGRGLRRRDDGHRDTELDGRDDVAERQVAMRSMLVSMMPIVVPLVFCLSAV